jgi:hypothetical protein
MRGAVGELIPNGSSTSWRASIFLLFCLTGSLNCYNHQPLFKMVDGTGQQHWVARRPQH